MRDSLRQIAHLTRVRLLLFAREPEVVFWVFFFPIVIALVLGWAFQDRGPTGERVGVLAAFPEDAATLIGVLESDDLLDVETFEDADEASRALARGKIATLVIPGEIVVVRHDPARSDTEVARLRVERTLRAAAPSKGSAETVRVEEVEGDVGSRYVDWLFPGLLGMNLMGTGVWSIGFGLAEMRQKRLMRRFLVTPMRRSSLLISFVTARLVLMVLEICVLVGAALWILGVPLRGSLLTFVAVCILGAIAFSTFGILLASRARTMEGISGVMNLAMMPMWLFSGVFFSAERFPDASQPFISALPLTALNDALRAVMLDGASIAELGVQLVTLLVWGAASFAVGLRIFRWE